ncbi:hypothetical protein PAXRUDRAFT_829722 [Paxillus rubicundulus Ve08.2h10]|uniref:Unplaced genomic scaffold scaffold_430, whole genome shotgun sequence n=1 Tax=Paxillus rubicundulus Ve08.2h10 TaxID=930991 RepID=A0A0D0E5E0_9AGAM|nr:hypothetical protein PAXRUDRAFT_829722 [Paxillus rubicundulus Ve08.2h10]
MPLLPPLRSNSDSESLLQLRLIGIGCGISTSVARVVGGDPSLWISLIGMPLGSTSDPVFKRRTRYVTSRTHTSCEHSNTLWRAA